MKLHKLFFVGVLTFFSYSVANAQSQKDICIALAPSMMSASDGMSSLRSSLASLDVSPILPKLSGEEKASFLALEERRKELLPYLEAFLNQLEDTAIVTRRCAR